jgi:hypothetical protein
MRFTTIVLATLALLASTTEKVELYLAVLGLF